MEGDILWIRSFSFLGSSGYKKHSFTHKLANVILIMCLLLQKGEVAVKAFKKPRTDRLGRHADHTHLHTDLSLVLQVFTQYIVILFQDLNHD